MHVPVFTPDMRHRKRSLHSTNADQKSLETVFLIAFCRQSGDKWQSKTMFLTIVDVRSLIVDLLTFSIATNPGGIVTSKGVHM